MISSSDPTAYSLHKLVFALDRVADQLIQAKFGISYKRALFLIVINIQGPLTQHNLALALGHTDPAVSAMATELTRDGYIAVSVSPEHRHRRIVELTAQGKKLAVGAQQYLDESFSQLMAAANIDEDRYNKQTTQIYKTLTRS